WITRTDERGEFRVAGMDYRRPYSVLLVSARHGNVRLWIDAADSAGEVDLGTVVLPAGARIHGVVRALDGRSVAGLAVSAVGLERVRLRAGTTFKNQRPSALTGGFQTTTNLDGQFAIAPLPEGEFFLLVAREQFGPFSLRSGEDGGPEVLEIGRDAETDGRSAIAGRVVDDGGRPVVDGFVQLFRETRPNALELLAATSVDSEGDFLLSAAAPGPFLFRALDIAGGFEEETIRFESVEEWNAGDIVLLPDPNGGSRVSGRVLGPSGEGLSNMKVTLHVSPAVTACTCVSRTDVTDRDGGFDLGPIADGAHRIVVVDPDGRFQPLDRFPVRPGDLLELMLEE
ncbi:MAG: carboxypeptidase-like regulatory domain-containing protein, partial [Actinobacteria bacterium]|nr:carboxypeptidase-like regulatory domain-containing protein [Actinomycetota bacterium]